MKKAKVCYDDCYDQILAEGAIYIGRDFLLGYEVYSTKLLQHNKLRKEVKNKKKER